MSITDELREYARHLHNVWYDPLDNVYTYTTMDFAPSLDAVRLDGYVLAIADRIDAEHKRQAAEAFTNGAIDGIDMAEHSIEYIKLPVDADGEPIHIGDVLTDDAEFKSEGNVMRLMLEDDGWMVGLGCDGWTKPSIHEWHHHHVPTVEDVLREFADQYAFYKEVEKGIHPNLESHKEVLRQFAAKLRLADE